MGGWGGAGKRARRSWESPSPEPESDDDTLSESSDEDSSWEEKFIQHQLDLYMVRSITAQEFCVSMFFCGESRFETL